MKFNLMVLDISVYLFTKLKLKIFYCTSVLEKNTIKITI